MLKVLHFKFKNLVFLIRAASLKTLKKRYDNVKKQFGDMRTCNKRTLIIEHAIREHSDTRTHDIRYNFSFLFLCILVYLAFGQWWLGQVTFQGVLKEEMGPPPLAPANNFSRGGYYFFIINIVYLRHPNVTFVVNNLASLERSKQNPRFKIQWLKTISANSSHTPKF